MNVAVQYRGFYKRDGKKGNLFNKGIIENHVKSIMSLSNIKEIHFFFHSYSVGNQTENELKQIFNGFELKRFKIEHTLHPKITHSIIESLKIVPDNYDLYINTRFDIIFLKPLCSFYLDMKKLNICFKDNEIYWNKQQKVSDLLYILPRQYIGVLIRALEDSKNVRPHGPGHFIYPYIENAQDIVHFMIDGFFSSNTDIESNYFLKIVRL